MVGRVPWPHPPRWKLIQIAQHAMRKTRSRGKKKREGGVGAEANEHRVPQSNWILEGRAELKRPINLQCKKVAIESDSPSPCIGERSDAFSAGIDPLSPPDQALSLEINHVI